MTTSMPSLTIEKNRYRLYVAYSCPFAHRVRLVRLLQPNLEDAIEVTYLTHQTTADGMIFDDDDNNNPDPEFNAKSLKEVYVKLDPSYSGKTSVPLLMDRKTRTIVNNDSMELAFALASSSHFDDGQDAASSSSSSSLNNLAPEGSKALAKELHENITSAPYRWLKTSDETVKQQIADDFWNELSKYNTLLGSKNNNQPYLLGETISIPDLILWITLIRYENIYNRQFGFIKGKQLSSEYTNLCEFIKRIWNLKSTSKAITLGEDATISEMCRMMWQTEPIAAVAGNDPKSPVPEVVPILNGLSHT